MWIFLGLLSSAACLVTKDVDFHVENSPPSAERKTPAHDFLYAPSTSDTACPGGDRTLSMQFEATIRDIDVDQTLQARLLVNGARVTQKEAGPATGNSTERTFEPLCVDVRRWLTQPCNRVELLVTSRFAFDSDDEYETTSEGDLAKVEWRVLPPAADDPSPVPADCLPPQQRGDGGTP